MSGHGLQGSRGTEEVGQRALRGGSGQRDIGHDEGAPRAQREKKGLSKRERERVEALEAVFVQFDLDGSGVVEKWELLLLGKARRKVSSMLCSVICVLLWCV